MPALYPSSWAVSRYWWGWGHDASTLRTLCPEQRIRLLYIREWWSGTDLPRWNLIITGARPVSIRLEQDSWKSIILLIKSLTCIGILKGFASWCNIEILCFFRKKHIPFYVYWARKILFINADNIQCVIRFRFEDYRELLTTPNWL